MKEEFYQLRESLKSMNKNSEEYHKTKEKAKKIKKELEKK